MGNYEKGLSLVIYMEINPALIKHKDETIKYYQNRIYQFHYEGNVLAEPPESCLWNPSTRQNTV
jgi:hypothetical protein